MRGGRDVFDRVSAELSPARALGVVVVAAVLLGTAGTALSLGPDGLQPETAATWRTVIGGGGLVTICVVAGQPPWRHRLWSMWAAVGAAGVAINQLAFFEAIDRTGVAIGTLVTIGAVPLAAGILDWAGGRRPGAIWASGVALAVVGVAFLTSARDQPTWDGVAFALLAGAAAAVLGLAAQRLMQDRPVLPAMATVVGGGALLLAPTAVIEADVAFASTGATTTVLFLGVVTMAAAYALWGVGLQHLTLGLVAAVTLLEPVVAALLAATVLDEPFTGSLVVGVGLVLCGVTVASRRVASGQPEAVAAAADR